MSVQQSLAAMLVDVLRDNDNPHIGWLVSISNESKKNILVKLDLWLSLWPISFCWKEGCLYRDMSSSRKDVTGASPLGHKDRRICVLYPIAT
ncbi:hypothetical protein BLOT_015518 [Blomia tropicalis]|nr:hypothetical protein BLOT_015518 [Blomia tropicalis]